MLRLREMKVCRLVGLVTLVILVSSQATVQAEERTPESLPRQGKQLGLSEPEQKYDLDISFPIDADEAVNNEGGRERIDQLIQAILNDEELVSVLHISMGFHNFMCISYQGDLNAVIAVLLFIPHSSCAVTNQTTCQNIENWKSKY